MNSVSKCPSQNYKALKDMIEYFHDFLVGNDFFPTKPNKTPPPPQPKI